MKKIHKLGAIFVCIWAIAAQKAPSSPGEILSQSPKNAWQEIDANEVVVFTLENKKQFIIELASKYSKVHSDNVKKLVRAGWFDKTQIVRVQENYVVQWGAPEGTIPPDNIIKQPPAEYDFNRPKNFTTLPYRDTYAKEVGYLNGWPAASDGKKAWLIHCYGMVGVGRDMAPDTGNGGELYSVISHSPRHLDRNINIVGRVIFGMENQTSLPRGTGQMGFYEKESEKLKIISAKIAADIPQEARPHFEALNTNSKTFQNWLYAKANRGAPFFIRPANAVDICNAQIPIRLRN